MTSHPLRRLFEPRALAVVGVSRREQAVGRRVYENIRQGGYAGTLYAINPELTELHGARVLASVSELPDGVDLVVIAVPAPRVAAVLRECGERSVPFAVVLSAGFAEQGAAGARLQAEMLAAAAQHGVRLLGPNCLGFMRANSALNASFSRGIARAGSLALLSQSGAVCSALVDWAAAHNVGLSTVVSLGAAADIGVGDVLDCLALDSRTDAILVYLEGVDHARRLMRGLRAAARLKPVIVVKSGRHPAAQKAIASHTAAITSDDAVFDAALMRAGAVRVATLGELFSAADVLAHAPRTRGNRIAILGNAGGLGVLAVDRARDLGLELARLDPQTTRDLAALLPPQAARDNPVDLLGDAPPERYRDALRLCLQDPNVDGVIVLLSPQQMTAPTEVASGVADTEQQSSKPVLACFMGGPQVEAARALLAQRDVACFASPEAAIEAFGVLAAHRRNQQMLLRLPSPRTHEIALDVAGARAVIDRALQAGRDQLDQLESKAILTAFGIPCLPAVLARDAHSAVAAAERLGYPVVLKLHSPDISHKTEVRGVRLALRDESAVRSAFASMLEDAARMAPSAHIEGCVVEPMHAAALVRELIVGVMTDPGLGPVIALGAGGTLVELLGPPAVALPPLDTMLVGDLVDRCSAARLLEAFRGQPAVDRAALERVLLAVSDLICELPEVRELDINPLVASEHGVMALDARVAIRALPADSKRHAHLALAPYPRERVQTVELEDGIEVTLRPVRPEDAEMEQRFVSSLSRESRYYRFLRGLSKLTPHMLVRFTQIDYDREMALLAVTGGPGAEHELGVARYIADPDGRACEMALVVADAWHRRGLGTALMRALMQAARDNGLGRMYGHVLAENAAMLSFVQRLGFEATPDPSDTSMCIVSCTL